MSNVTVSLTEFYNEYPEFNTVFYKAICPGAFRRAKNFISIKNNCTLNGDNRKNVIYLLTAHLSVLSGKNQSTGGSGGGGGTGGLVASASVGEVSVSYVQIPSVDGWSYWLASTPYGLELLALLDLLTSGGFYVGGTLERVF